jgi:predicted DNA-binding transcriptional regulator AlpA
MAKKYLRKRAVAERYGGVTPRTIERMVKDGRLPEPEYPAGRFPMWDEAKLDECDRAATLRPNPKRVVGERKETAAEN